ncbi:Subtilase-type proteinase psp3 [Zancudomyces culisetae]|uniref:Subtilase-type proteinase psp3 n=1 Tax=Zancudomyces culisetae TaxID=1213189 RepID=A0A1R1PIL9_ZANCU|nr:Subtilase-type proteinase psp3 [Zancudomyces culisetae]OMH80855.1 Subtilase-type proteinase psp3 [Zancudomyces culisetae]|eukprot:OMH80514.1 Subtilase-type proteinase psp3 [Zancudomyces culisetae]
MRIDLQLFMICTLFGLVSSARTGGPAKITYNKATLRAAPTDKKRFNVILRGSTVSKRDQVANFASNGESEKLHSTYLIGNNFAGYTATLSADTINLVSNQDEVAYIEEDMDITIHVYQKFAPWGLGRLNKEKNDRELNVYDVDYKVSETGKGVTVYLIDSGIRATHMDFEGRVADQVAFVSSDKSVDERGHGTGVAGVVGGKRTGVAKDATLKSIKVIDNTSGSVSTVLKGIQWVMEDYVNGGKKPSIVNMSVGLESSHSNSMDDSVAAMISSGLQVIVAAGNTGIDACNISPSSVSDSVVVGAISNDSDKYSKFSNMGSCITLSAPGELILRPISSDDVSFIPSSGTSVAAPIVTGLVALYLEKNPTATPAQIKQYLIDTSKAAATSTPKDTTNLIAQYVSI